jgi:carbamoyltransferase
MSYLGISSGFHDASVSVIDYDGEIKFAGHSERYSKQKNDSRINDYLMADAYEHSGLITHIAYYEKPLLKQLRNWRAGIGFDWSRMLTCQVLHQEISPRVWKMIGTGIPTSSHSHHKSHAAAGFQTSSYNDATVVVIDAIGEFDTVSIWHAEYDRSGYAQYKKLWSQKYPHSIGLFYSAMTQRAGLKPNEDEYILMGMSAYARPDYNVFAEFVKDKEKLEFYDNLHLGCNEYRPEMTDFQIASSAQYTVEQCVYNIMDKARKLGKSKNLVYMGGVALNCSANEQLGNYFDNIWIMPNPGDAGSSLGAAALAYGKQVNWKDAYLGTDIPGEYPVNGLLDQLLDKKIVGVASGRAEFGPRALGNRSLLADPRGPEIKDQVNEIKRRQKFRPFAPVILEEYVNEYFQMPQGFSTSPYMQTVATCKKPSEFPAIIHHDGTSRVQTVSKDCDSGIRQLLEKWFVLTGCPMLLNTSLNIKGEPMVNDREDADRFEQRYGVKVVS